MSKLPDKFKRVNVKFNFANTEETMKKEEDDPLVNSEYERLLKDFLYCKYKYMENY